MLELASDATGSTPNIPVGTTCTITEDPPVGGLIDGSFAWGATPGVQPVTITASGQVVAVTLTNDVVRVRVAVHRQGADHAGRRGRIRRGRSPSDYRCVYGNDRR